MKKMFLLACISICLLLQEGIAQPTLLKQVQYLSGTGSNHTVTWDFFCTAGRKSGYWTNIQVPSCWEQQGFGAYNYGRDYKTYGKNFRFADEKGLYRHRFNLPAGWKNKTVFLVFEGAMTDAEVKINGRSAGPVHQGAFYRFRYNITGKLLAGQSNLLEVTVCKLSADASVNNAERLADYWVFGGIFRPVYLEAFPPEYLDELAIDARADGRFTLRASVAANKPARSVVTEIFDASGKLHARAQQPVSPGDSALVLHSAVPTPVLWTAETPYRYKARISLVAGNKILYQCTQPFGFRTIEIRKGQGIYLNGVQVKLKGTNRHCFWPETGRTLDSGVQQLDIRLLKAMNMNAVRCAHYPPDTYFLDLCDSLGLYVLDELAGWQKWYGTEPGKKLVKEMVLRDVNHPSILFWDNGNEGGTNKELDSVFGRYDPSARPVIHPHHRPGNAFNGIDCNHYEDYYSTRNILSDTNIYLPTEFLHAQDDGGGGAALADFWELHWQAQRSGGGFIWSMLDEAVARTDFNNQLDANGVNAPDGILGPHREKEGSFYAIREIFSPIRMLNTTLDENFSGILPLENRYHFTNTRQCRFSWQLVRFSQPGDDAAGYRMAKEGIAAAPDIAPGRRGQLSLSLPANWKQYDALLVAATGTDGSEIYRWTWRIPANTTTVDSLLVQPAAGNVQVKETDSLVLLSAAGITVGFSKQDGGIVQVKGNNGDQLSFSGGPLPASGTGRFTGLRHYREKKDYVVEVQYQGTLQQARWKMQANGWLCLDYVYQLEGSYPFMGISFTYPENYVLGVKWQGKGPGRVWKNRLQGVAYGVWQKQYNDTHTGAAPWLYPEFKGYYAGVEWMELNTVEGKWIVAGPTSGLFVRLFDFYGLSGVRPSPSLPPGNLSFLDGIPPIGTKLALNIDGNTAKLGPASELNKAAGTYRRTLYFYFGLLQNPAQQQQYTAPVKDELF